MPMHGLKKFRFAKNELKQLALIPLSYQVNRPLAMPTLANISLTSRCDSRCRMCDFWRPEFAYPDELTTEEWKRVLGELKDIGVQAISVSAEGEVLTRKDLFEILGHIRTLEIPYSINSNFLTLDAERARQL